MNRKSVFPFLFLLMAQLSCSRAEPRILYGFFELVYYSGKEKPEERYSFFILPEDDDGMENLSELYLYNDSEGLRWLINSEDWVRFETEGKTWIGSRNIAMRDAPLPRGQYRAVLVNKGGESTERQFTFDAPEEAPYPFPDLRIQDGSYSVTSRYPVNSLVCYDEQGKAVQTVPLTGHRGSLGELALQANVRSAALWADDPEYHISAFTEAAAIR